MMSLHPGRASSSSLSLVALFALGTLFATFSTGCKNKPSLIECPDGTQEAAANFVRGKFRTGADGEKVLVEGYLACVQASGPSGKGAVWEGPYIRFKDEKVWVQGEYVYGKPAGTWKKFDTTTGELVCHKEAPVGSTEKVVFSRTPGACSGPVRQWIR